MQKVQSIVSYNVTATVLGCITVFKCSVAIAEFQCAECVPYHNYYYNMQILMNKSVNDHSQGHMYYACTVEYI